MTPFNKLCHNEPPPPQTALIYLVNPFAQHTDQVLPGHLSSILL